MWAAQQIAALQYAAALQQQQFMLASSAPTLNPFLMPPRQELDEDASDTDDEDDEQKRTLFCGNLDERVTEELLYEVFLQAGPIESVRIPKDGGGKQRSFGFVTYIHQCTAPYAMRLFAGLALFRKTLTIKFQGENSSLSASRRSLPSDCERYNSGGMRSSGSYDNSVLRSASFPNFYAANMNGSPPTLSGNPFRPNSPEGSPHRNANDWTKGSSSRRGEKERIAKHASGNTRAHDTTGPYQRSESLRRGGSDSHDSDRRHGNDHQKRSYHNSGNRRSEQRSNQRR